ncbi:hypothetical protein AVEN_103034-1 [Araneus ventricosus]|uniref:Uncharacterized protein n=1 Tax=Araneus ventricosus TaxID=182803 RepID=A0A4Y2B8M8_ARAVE|nr:hypothetical protein AVEN_103034-1 [Araneus ventricosus]
MKNVITGVSQTVQAVLEVIDRFIRTINRTGTASGIRRLPHRWKLFGHNVGDYIERLVVGFETRKMLGKTLEALTNAGSVVIIWLPLLISQPAYSIHVCCFD